MNKTLVFKNTIKIQHNQVYVSCKIFQLFGFSESQVPMSAVRPFCIFGVLKSANQPQHNSAKITQIVPSSTSSNFQLEN